MAGEMKDTAVAQIDHMLRASVIKNSTKKA